MAGLLTVTGVAAVVYFWPATPPPVSSTPLNASLDNQASGEMASLQNTPSSSGAAEDAYDLGAHQTLSRVILLIRENYVDPERVSPQEMFNAALDYIQKTVPEVMINDAEAPHKWVVSVGSAQQTFEIGNMDQLWEVTMALRDIFRFLQTHIEPVDERRDIEYAAINGMLSTLDPHSILLKPENFDEMKLSTKGEFGGLGIVISMKEGSLTIISPIEGTPADKAGLKAKDQIVKIGEESTVNMNIDEAVDRLRGEPGSKVSIWVMRKGWTESRKYVLTRAVIKIESVSSQLLADGVGYVRIKSFQNNTDDDLIAHLEMLRSKNGGALKGLVLDLRNNPGGLLDQAIFVSDRFIEKGPLVVTVGEGNRKREVKNAHMGGTEPNYPMAVLVNGGSASASEIVSGALKSHNRAVVIGQQTFGKGSVQVLYDFKDKSALKLTIAQYLTPGDVSIQSVGIRPDVEIRPVEVEPDALHVFVDDDALREKDLDKHLSQQAGAQKASREEAVAARLLYVLPKANDAESEDAKPDAFKYDFEIGLAHDLLVKAKGSDRRTLLGLGGGLFKERGASQLQAIAARLKEMGVDWSSGKQEKAPRLEIVWGLASGDKPVRAGETLEWVAKVKNTGDAPAFKVYGTASSDNPLLKNMEFVFGKIAPGETRTWTRKVKIPKDLGMRADAVDLVVKTEDLSAYEQKARAMVVFEEQQKPRFSYTYRIDDSAPGNGDGVLQVGEEVTLWMGVKNVGLGVAEEAVASLKNATGKEIFVQVGREKLGTLKPGEGKQVKFVFAVREQVASSDVMLKTQIWDGALGVSLSDVLHLPLDMSHTCVSQNKTLVSPTSSQVTVWAGAHEKMPIAGVFPAQAVLQATALCDAWWKIKTDKGVYGYVRVKDVHEGRNPAKNHPAFESQKEGQSPPDVYVQPSALITKEGTVRLTGYLEDTSVPKDMFVFVNDKKVYYKAFAVEKNKAQGRIPIDFSVPLKPGSNTVSMLVRENDELAGRRVVGVFRDVAAVAAGSDVAKPAQKP
jgi:carboxyl-terminal processing protease